jgi:Rrf2 family protein
LETWPGTLDILSGFWQALGRDIDVFHPVHALGAGKMANNMTVSTKGRYGLRLLLDIALHQAQGAVNLGDIAQRQEISPKYLWQVVNPLKAGGVVRVTRGAKGGYVLAKPAERITLCEVLELLEGPVALVDCVSSQGDCDRTADCITREIWCELTATIQNALRGITLAEIVERARARVAANEPSYII